MISLAVLNLGCLLPGGFLAGILSDEMRLLRSWESSIDDVLEVAVCAAAAATVWGLLAGLVARMLLPGATWKGVLLTWLAVVLLVVVPVALFAGITLAASERIDDDTIGVVAAITAGLVWIALTVWQVRRARRFVAARSET